MNKLLEIFDKRDLKNVLSALEVLSEFYSSEDELEVPVCTGLIHPLEVYTGHGICDVLESNNDILFQRTDLFDVENEVDDIPAYALVKSISVLWPSYSGHKSYPVYPKSATQYADNYFHNCRNKWANDEFGDLRRDLCKFIAEKISEYLGEAA